MSDSVITFILVFVVPATVILAAWFFLGGFLRKLERDKRRSPIDTCIAFSVIVYLYISGLLIFIFACVLILASIIGSLFIYGQLLNH